MTAVYCDTNNSGITLRRVVDQVKATAPASVEFVSHLEDADYAIVLSIGPEGVMSIVDRVPSVILQLCYKTGGPKEFWDEVWMKSVMVGSYYDLDPPVPFIRFPMGFDPSVFHQTFDSSWSSRPYSSIVTGRVEGPEEIRSVYNAFGIVAHIGHDFHYGPGYTNYENISDMKLSTVYSQSQYTVGLRRIEGFELPVVEGLACGCQAITFDMECYRHWFDGLVHFVDPDKDVTEQLAVIAKDRPYLKVDKRRLVDTFSLWNAWDPFWKLFLQVVK